MPSHPCPKCGRETAGDNPKMLCYDCGVEKPKGVHCWEDGPKQPDGMGTTCMEESGHTGPHVWARDDSILIRFKESK